MLLEVLEEKRRKNPLSIKRLLKIIGKSPVWIQPAEPKKRPIIIDKLCLMELGLTETQAEILLVLWEAGGKLPIWGNGENDLCHELGTTSSTIRKHLKKLEELKFIKVNYDGKKQIVKVKSPREISGIIEKSLNARFKILLKLFEIKQKEFEENKQEEILPKKYNLSLTAKKDLKELEKSEKIVCGFVTGRIKDNGKIIVVEKFIPIKTRSGPKIHFNPMWKDYHRVKKELIANKKWIIGEFHTHPDGSLKLHEKDLEKMNMLCRGMWWIIGKGTICYFFNKKDNNLEILKIPKSR